MSTAMEIIQASGQNTVSDIVGKYNHMCLNKLTEMYDEKQFYLGENKYRREILKGSDKINVDDFQTYCRKNGYPDLSSMNKLSDYPFCVKNKLDYDFFKGLSSENIYPFPELNLLLSHLSFENPVVILNLLKIFLIKKRDSLKDIQSEFYNRVCDNIPSEFKHYDTWNEFLEDDISETVKLEFVRMFVQHHPYVHLYIRLCSDDEQEEVMYERICVDVEPIYEKYVVMSNGGRQMLERMLGHTFNLQKHKSYQLFCGWFIYDKQQSDEKDKLWYTYDEMSEHGDDYITETPLETLEWTDTFLYDEKEYIWTQMMEGNIYPRFLVYMNTFRRFLYECIKPEDRERYCFAGSMVKSFHRIREVKDIDFLVSDTYGKIETYGCFKPQLGKDVKNIMDDFSRTYYGVEKFYFQMIPEFYKSQKKTRDKQWKTDDISTYSLPSGSIMNIVPKYSTSGLKAGRYIEIYSRLINAYLEGMNIVNDDVRPYVDTLDDLVFYPAHNLSVGGIKFLTLECEILRDHIKDIDLKRVSRKQMMDFCEVNKYYAQKQNNPELWSKLLGIDSFRLENHISISLFPRISLEWNLYHGKVYGENDVGCLVLIRRSPLKLNETIKNMLKDNLLVSINGDDIRKKSNAKLSLHLNKHKKPKELIAVVHTCDDWKENGRFMKNILITSIPGKIERLILNKSNEEYHSIWNYVITQKGELNINLITNPYELGSWTPSFVRNYDKIVSAGQFKVIDDEKSGSKDIYFNMMSSIVIPLFKQYGKEYENILFQFTKSVFQSHRLFDILAGNKISFHYITEPISFDGITSCWGSGFKDRIFKTTNVETMKQWQEQSKKNISDISSLIEYLKKV